MAWYHPAKNETIVARCYVCDDLTFSYPRPTKLDPGARQVTLSDDREVVRLGGQFHESPCYESVRKALIGAEVFAKEGAPPKSENLKRAFCWAVRYLLFDEGFKTIATDERQDPKFVKRQIKRILPLVPHPNKVARRYKKIVSMVRDKANQKGLPKG